MKNIRYALLALMSLFGLSLATIAVPPATVAEAGQPKFAARKTSDDALAKEQKSALKVHKRGAKPTPRHKLLSAPRHTTRATIPTQLAVVPKQLSMWLNDVDGDCVTAEEAWAKAWYSVFAGLPELFIPDAEVQSWASAGGYLNGATLTDVMDSMARSGFVVNGVTYNDGPYTTVDYSNVANVQSALSTGCVKIGIDADALPSTAGNGNGWYAVGGSPQQFTNEDHCIGLGGYGTSAFIFAQLGITLPSGLTGTESGYLAFTWSSLGFVDEAWVMSTVQEAWVRNPTTPGATPPTPAPTPSPVPTVVTITLGSALAAGTYQVVPTGSVVGPPGSVPISPGTTLSELGTILSGFAGKPVSAKTHAPESPVMPLSQAPAVIQSPFVNPFGSTPGTPSSSCPGGVVPSPATTRQGLFGRPRW